MIREYYQALQDRDTKKFRQMLHPDLFGIRTFEEEVYYDRNAFIKNLDNLDYQEVVISNITTDDALVVEGKINNEPFIAKITIKDNLIYKVYETIKIDYRRIKCIIAYDGSMYSGYQKQKNTSSVQGTFEYTLKKALKQDIIIHSSGRTDKGVHANNQVIHFDINMSIPLYNLKTLLNSYLPDSIYIKEISEENQTYHSRYDVLEKTYCYKMNLKEYDAIQRNYEWFVKDLNIKKYQDTLEEIIGTHDFQSFTKSTDKDTLRTIYDVKIVKREDALYTYITGNGFLRYMVRNIIGAAVKISKNEVEYTMDFLLSKKDVTLVKDKAPANGLYLDKVKY